MLYRYDKNKLMFINIKKRLIHILYLFLLTNILSFFYGRYSKTPIVDRYEKEIILMSVNDESYDFSKENLVTELKRLNIKFPHIVMAQSMVETGYWESDIFYENHNLFGMKEARIRVNTALGTNRNHAYYSDWVSSVLDYAFYQSTYLKDLKTEEQYYNYLSRSYAESENYVNSVKSMVIKEKLVSLFD